MKSVNMRVSSDDFYYTHRDMFYNVILKIPRICLLLDC